MTPVQRFLPTLLLNVALLPALHAAESSAGVPAASAIDEEEQVDEGLKQFGYLAGLARGCVVENQKPAFEREALDLHAAIARLLGTDRAFLFSSSFGYGTTVQVETEQCVDVLKNYEARVEKYRAARGGTK